MSVSPVPAHPTSTAASSALPRGLWETVKIIAITITQIAIQVFFVQCLIVMTAAVTPLSLHAVVLPAMGISGAFLSSFFFTSASRVEPISLPAPTIVVPPSAAPTTPVSDSTVPVPVPAHLLTRELEDSEAPRGNYRQQNNCAFNNGLIHFLQSDPQTAAWARNLFPESEVEKDYTDFFAEYKLSQTFIDAFKKFIQDQPKNSPFQISVKNFFESKPQLGPGDFPKWQELQKLSQLAPVFRKYFAAYDQAVADKKMVVNCNAQELRCAINEICPALTANCAIQVDAQEVLGAVMDLLPPSQKILRRQNLIFPKTELPPPAARGQANPEPSLFIPLQVNGFSKLERSLGNACKYLVDSGLKVQGNDGMEHDYRKVVADVVFVEAPTVLRFHVKRFKTEESQPASPVSKDSTPTAPPASPESKKPVITMKKVDEPLEAPELLKITLEDKSEREYRLSGFVNHEGSTPYSGHYTAGRLINGKYYLINDTEVMLLNLPEDQEAWEHAKDRAYLYCYAPV